MCTYLSTHVKDSSALPAFPLHHRLDSDIYPVAPQDQLAAGGQIKLKRIATAGYKIGTQSDGDNHDDDDDDEDDDDDHHHHHADAGDADSGDDDDVHALDAHDATVDGGGDDAMMLLLLMMMMMISEYHFIQESCSICF